MRTIWSMLAILSFAALLAFQFFPISMFNGSTLLEKTVLREFAQTQFLVIFLGSLALARIESLHEKIAKK